MHVQEKGFRFFDLTGKTLLLTGVTRGIGRALLPGILEQGMNVIALGRGKERLEQLRRSMEVDGDRMRLVECDLADPSQVRAAAKQIKQDVPSLLGIVHNAAIDPRRGFENSNPTFWSEVFQVNLFSAVELTRRLLPLLKTGQGGRVVFIGSVVFDLGPAYLGAYSASKGAVVGITRSLAHELKGSGMTVNCLVPGAIAVEKNHPDTPQKRRTVLSWQTVERILTPSDLLAPLCLLLSRAGGGINGQSITVDGGLLHPIATRETQESKLQ